MVRRLVRPVLALCAAAGALAVALPLVLLALPFWLVSGLTRSIACLLEPRYIFWDRLLEFDAALGWKPRANLDAHYLTAEEPDIFSVRTDSQGWPGRLSLGEADAVVFGDSYAFGYGVDARATFWEQPGAFRIKAIGCPAYNMVQELLVMRQVASGLRGKHVVWFIFLGNDLLENLFPAYMQYRMPFVRATPGHQGCEIVTSHISPRKWPFVMEPFHSTDTWTGMRLDLYRASFLAERAYAACEFLIRQGMEVCRENGASLTVMTIPDPSQVRGGELERLAARVGAPGPLDPDLPDVRIREICSRLGAGFVAGKTFLESRDYKAVDPHWSEEGHRRVAEVLQRLVAEAARPSGTKPAVGHVLAS